MSNCAILQLLIVVGQLFLASNATWKCSTFKRNVRTANWLAGNQSAGAVSPFCAFRLGILHYEGLTVDHWLKLVNQSDVRDWAGQNYLEELFEQIGHTFPYKTEESVQDALLHLAIVYKSTNIEVGERNYMECIMEEEEEEGDGKAAKILFAGFGGPMNEREVVRQMTKMKWPDDLFTEMHDFDFISQWSLKRSTQLNVTYLKGKMKRKAYIFKAIAGARFDEDNVKKFVESISMNKEEAHLKAMKLLCISQMLAAFKHKFGFSKFSQLAAGGHFDPKDDCNKLQQNDTDGAHIFCRVQYDEDLKKDLVYPVKQHNPGWAVNEHSPSFKLVIEQLEFHSWRQEFSFYVPQMLYEALTEEEAAAIDQGHESAEFIFPEEYDDPTYPDIFADA